MASIFGAYDPRSVAGLQPYPKPSSAGLAAPGNLTDPYKLYNTAVQQQAGDYSNIMKGYQDLLSKGPSSDQAAATRNLGELATTGGYSPEGIAAIRARGISPIRSIYASANRDVDRQRALQGGYSPNYNAVKAKMARELSDTIANKTTDVEGMIAQNVAQNRLSAGGAYANAANQESQVPLEALRGQVSLYGTTPALANLFGNQALAGAQFQNQINQQNKNDNLNLISRLVGAFG